MPELVNITEPNAHALELIEACAERLRSGESIAVALVEVRKGRTVGSAWSEAPDGSYHLLNSGVARLAHRLASQSD